MTTKTQPKTHDGQPTRETLLRAAEHAEGVAELCEAERTLRGRKAAAYQRELAAGFRKRAEAQG